MNKVYTIEDAINVVKDHDTVLMGGFLLCGYPYYLVEQLNKTTATNLTVVSSDTGTSDCPTYELMKSGRVKKVVASYIGANSETGRLYMTKEAEVELVPQGTFAERIRAAGAGLGGVLTPTGVGTMVEEGKKTFEIDGKKFLLERPIRGNVALIKAQKGDTLGNLVLKGTAKNFNEVMATAADFVIAQVDELVEPGDINPEEVCIPSIFVDAVVKVGA